MNNGGMPRAVSRCCWRSTAATATSPGEPSEDGPTHDELAPYTSLPDVAWTRLPGLPYRLLMRSHVDSRARITSVRVPLLVVRGSDDRTVPPEQSQLVFDAANQPKQIVTISGADHDLRGTSGPTGIEAAITYLRATLAGRGR